MVVIGVALGVGAAVQSQARSDLLGWSHHISSVALLAPIRRV